MPDPQESEPGGPPSWETLEERIHWWLVVRFGLNGPRDKDIWLFCIGAAMDLERMAVASLWIADGRPGPWPDYKPTMTLGRARREIEKRGLFDTVTRETLKNVAGLRNSVGHRDAIFVTMPSPLRDKRIGEYKGRHVFSDRAALEELMCDVEAAQRVLFDWMAAQAPDLAAAARQSGAHPTSL